jgi:hypothetical protein
VYRVHVDGHNISRTFKAEVSIFLSPGSASNLMVASRHSTDEMHCVRQTLLPGIDDVIGPTVENAAPTQGTEKRGIPDVGCPFWLLTRRHPRKKLQRLPSNDNNRDTYLRSGRSCTQRKTRKKTPRRVDTNTPRAWWTWLMGSAGAADKAQTHARGLRPQTRLRVPVSAGR